jgi:hypothetical protein
MIEGGLELALSRRRYEAAEGRSGGAWLVPAVIATATGRASAKWRSRCRAPG